MFSINEVNRNSDLLPNMSLIFTFSALICDYESQLKSLIHLSLQNHEIFPNYICNDDVCAVALTGLNWTTTLTLYTILNNFMSHQVSVCVFVCVCVCVCVCASLQGHRGQLRMCKLSSTPTSSVNEHINNRFGIQIELYHPT